MPSPPPLRILIVDDEPLARRRLENLLAPKPEVEVVAQARSGREAVAAIEEKAPDLVFLDVQMPGLSGVDVVRTVGPERMPETIFVTAYDEYALDAFELAALDYLVKPFEDERFEAAFARAARQVRLRQKGRTTDRMLDLLRRADRPGEAGHEEAGRDEKPPGYLERIAVETPGRMRIIAVRDIDYITADGSYAELHVGKDRYPIRERMKTLAERLDPEVFVRIHRSTIVRLDRIASVLTGDGGQYAVELRGGGPRLRLSRGRRDELRQRLGLDALE